MYRIFFTEKAPIPRSLLHIVQSKVTITLEGRVLTLLSRLSIVYNNDIMQVTKM